MEMGEGSEVIMPQMGESIAQGTLTRWLVAVGDRVERDQPLFEVSTDKVDAEIPSPASGVLTRIYYPVGTKVPVNTVVAWIGPGAPDIAEAPPPVEGPVALSPAASSLARDRTVWGVLILWFTVRLLGNLYDFAQGKEGIYTSLPHAAALLFGVAQLVTAKKGLPYKLLLLASGALLLAFVVAFFRVHLS
jgi:pyruvate/2-oxoglutarate dehydrogenase complex dihydrolipoamide acyltransferase (E2) component